MHINTASRYLLGCLLLLCPLSAAAIEVHLLVPFVDRGVIYQHFDTKQLTLTTLRAMQQHLGTTFTDLHSFGLISLAIDTQQFKHHSNAVYLNPPIAYEGKTLYQVYPYDIEFVERLESLLAAVITQTPKNEAAIRKLRGVIDLRVRQQQAQAPLPQEVPVEFDLEWFTQRSNAYTDSQSF
jgi:hypothetical protein